MKHKNIFIACTCILALALIAFFILQASSLKMALSHAGVDTNGTLHEIVELDTLIGDKQFKVVQGITKDGLPALVQLEKSWLGFWEVAKINTPKTDAGQTYASTVWIKGAGIQLFDPASEEVETGHEWHYAYCGMDAQRKISIPAEDIPNNVTINIQQTENLYIIHVISFADPADLGDFSIPTYLKGNGFIP